MNIAVLGCGTVSRHGHLPAIAESGRWHLRAIVEPDEGRRNDAAATFKPDAALASAEELWRVEGLDAVVVATHLDSHFALTMAALERGLHVLCEKPMAPTLEQCRAMSAAAERAGRLLAINFNTRSMLAYRQIRRIVEAGTLGKIHVARFVYNWSCHQWKPPERLEHFMANGGPIVDSGVHFFDGVRLYTGSEFTSIEASGVFLPPYRHPQHVIATGRLADGSVALVEAGWLYTKHTRQADVIYRVELIGQDGAVAADLIQSRIVVHGRDGSREETIERADKAFDWVYEQLAQSIEAGRLIGLASGADGVAATKAALDALAASEREHGRE